MGKTKSPSGGSAGAVAHRHHILKGLSSEQGIVGKVAAETNSGAQGISHSTLL